MSAVRFDRWMEDAGWSVTRLSAVLGVSREAIYGWLRGDFLPSSKNLRRLCMLSEGAIQILSFPPPSKPSKPSTDK